MEGSPARNSCLMGFGDNSNGLSSLMMMPLMTSPPNAETNSLFLPLPSSNNHNSSSGSSLILDDGSNNNNNNNNSNPGCYFMENNSSSSRNSNNDNSSSSSIRARILAHPQYPRLLSAYVNCQKVGAPPEVVAKLEEACASEEAMGRTGRGCIGEDPALDQFMEAYCEMLTKYEQELTKPFKEAMMFLSRIECQFKALTVSSVDSGAASLSSDMFLQLIGWEMAGCEYF